MPAGPRRFGVGELEGERVVEAAPAALDAAQVHAQHVRQRGEQRIGEAPVDRGDAGDHDARARAVSAVDRWE